MKKQPLTKKQSELVNALRKQLQSLERDLAYHKEVLERFQQSAAWRWTGPVRRVANLFRSFGEGRHTATAEAPLREVSNETELVVNSPPKDYFTGMCRVSFEAFSTSGATLETSRSDHPEIAVVLKELAAKEREIEQQKWVFERFQESPAWRWTAPIRWFAAQVPWFTNGHTPVRRADVEDKPTTGEDPESAANRFKTFVTDLCRDSLEDFLASGTLLELPRSERPSISIILVLFNRAELTLACLRSIVAHAGVDIEIVIVDNASSDETPQLLDRLRGARIIRNSSNRHFLAAANQAASECRSEYLLLLNNDAQLLPDAVQSALDTLESSPDIGAVGGRIILLDGTLQEAGSIVWKDGSCAGYGRGDEPFAPMYSFRRDVDYCSGAFLLTPRRIWNDLGGFDHAFEPAYYEETDYCMRLWERGLRVVYEPNATILHYEFGSSESSSAAIDLQAKNQNVFAELHRMAIERHEAACADRIVHARSNGPRRRILFVDDRVPHRWLGSGFPRAHALHRALLNLGYFVTLFPTDIIDESWEGAYSDFPREVEIMMGAGRSKFESFLRARKGYYQKIIVSRPHNMELLAQIRKKFPDWFENVEVIYDAEALFAEREVAHRKLRGDAMPEDEIRRLLSSEVSLAGQADCVFTVSENEKQVFHKYGIKRVEVIGHSIEATLTETPFEVRLGFLFVGAVHDDRSPNADSLVWFVNEVFPAIQKRLGDITFTVAGVNQSDRVAKLASPLVRITGSLPSLQDLYAHARVFVAPTRYAAGIPHKIHEAAAYGLPVVATPLLAQQLGWTDRELSIGKTSEGFAEQCVAAYTDRERWTSLREAAFRRVRQECSPQAFEDRVRSVLDGV